LGAPSKVEYLHIAIAVESPLKAEEPTYTLQLLLKPLLKAEHLHITVALVGPFESRATFAVLMISYGVYYISG